MHFNPLICALTLLSSTSAAAAQAVVTTSETDTDGLPTGTVTFVEPTDGAIIPGSPDATVQVIVEFSGAVANVALNVDGEQSVDCPNENATQCTAEVTLTPGDHTISATGTDIIGLGVSGAFAEISVTVTAETATTGGPTTDGSTGAPDGSSGGSDGSSGDSDTGGGTPDKGCDCDANDRPAPALALLLGLVALGRRRKTR